MKRIVVIVMFVILLVLSSCSQHLSVADYGQGYIVTANNTDYKLRGNNSFVINGNEILFIPYEILGEFSCLDYSDKTPLKLYNDWSIKPTYIESKEITIRGRITNIKEVWINGYSFPELTLQDENWQGKVITQSYILDMKASNYEVGRTISMQVTNEHWHNLWHVLTSEYTDNMNGRKSHIILWEQDK